MLRESTVVGPINGNTPARANTIQWDSYVEFVALKGLIDVSGGQPEGSVVHGRNDTSRETDTVPLVRAWALIL